MAAWNHLNECGRAQVFPVETIRAELPAHRVLPVDRDTAGWPWIAERIGDARRRDPSRRG